MRALRRSSQSTARRERVAFGTLVVSALLFHACKGREGHLVPAPRLEIPAPVYSFAQTLQGSRIEHEFFLRNGGATALRIARIESGPRIAIVSFDRRIAPGGHGAVRLALDTSNLVGEGSVRATLVSNDPTAPRTLIGFRGRIVPPVEILPQPQAYFFGLRGVGGRLDLTLVNHRREPLRIVAATSDSTAFTAEVRPLDDGSRIQLRIGLRADAPVGSSRGTLTLRTASATQPEITLPLRAEVSERVSATPSVVSFGALSAEVVERQGARRTVLVRSRSGPPLHLLGLKSDLRYLALSYRPAPTPSTYLLEIAIPEGTRIRGSISGTLEVRTDDPGVPLLRLPIRGEIR